MFLILTQLTQREMSSVKYIIFLLPLIPIWVRSSILDLRLKFQDNYFCTYPISAEKITRNKQTALNPNVEKFMTPRSQSHPRALTMYLLEGFPPLQWISLQFLQPIQGNPRWGHSCLFIFGLGLRSANKHKTMMRTGSHNQPSYSFLP